MSEYINAFTILLKNLLGPINKRPINPVIITVTPAYRVRKEKPAKSADTTNDIYESLSTWIARVKKLNTPCLKKC